MLKYSYEKVFEIFIHWGTGRRALHLFGVGRRRQKNRLPTKNILLSAIRTDFFARTTGILVYSADKLYSFSYTYDQTGERQLPGAYKYEKSALISVYSSSDGVYLISSDGNDKKLTGKADDFTVYGSRVFVASGSDVIIFDTSSDSTFTVSAGNRITSIAYSGNKCLLFHQKRLFRIFGYLRSKRKRNFSSFRLLQKRRIPYSRR